MHRMARYKLAGLLAVMTGAVWLTGCHNEDGEGVTAEEQRIVEQVIGPGGGTITSGDGRLTLTFPQGALPANNTIVIETMDPDNPPAPFAGRDDVDAAYDLRPDGLTFDAPVTARFDVGNDPIADDGTIEMPLSVLATQGQDGSPVPLANLRKDIDPDTGLTRVTGELSHFTPIIEFQDLTGTFLVINGVPFSLSTDETFMPQAIVTVDPENSIFDAVGEARYRDFSTPPVTRAESRDMEQDGPAFVTEAENGCEEEPGDGLYRGNIRLLGVRYDFEAEAGEQEKQRTYEIQGERSVTCTAPDDDGGGDDEVVFNTFQNATRISPVAELPDGTLETFPNATFAVGILNQGGMTEIQPLDEDLNKIEPSSITADGDFTNDATAVSDGDPDTERDAVAAAGADGLMQFRDTATSGLITNRLSSQPTFGLNAFENLNDDGIDDSYSSAGFEDGTRTFRPGMDGSGFREDDDVQIEPEDVDGETIVSVHIGPGGFDAPGDFAIVLTQADPANGDLSSALWECVLQGEPGALAVACGFINANIGDNALRVVGLEPNPDGDSVLLVSIFGDRKLRFVFINTTRFDSGIAVNGGDIIEDVQGVTAALRWVPGDSTRAEFVSGNIPADQLVGGVVNIDSLEVEEVQRMPEPDDEDCEDPAIEHVLFTRLARLAQSYLMASGLCASGVFVFKTPAARLYEAASYE